MLITSPHEATQLCQIAIIILQVEEVEVDEVAV
jgi:hypothetical protein